MSWPVGKDQTDMKKRKVGTKQENEDGRIDDNCTVSAVATDHPTLPWFCVGLLVLQRSLLLGRKQFYCFIATRMWNCLCLDEYSSTGCSMPLQMLVVVHSFMTHRLLWLLCAKQIIIKKTAKAKSKNYIEIRIFRRKPVSCKNFSIFLTERQDPLQVEQMDKGHAWKGLGMNSAHAKP